MAAARTLARELSVLAACALALACSFGGQSSDDGAPDSGAPDSGTPDSGGPVPDAGEPDTDVVVGVQLEGSVTIGCGAGFRAEDVLRDPAAAVLSAPQRCEGSPGAFSCVCDGQNDLSYAFSCSVALLQACGVPAELLDGSGGTAPIATECEGHSGAYCALDAGDEYACTCDTTLEGSFRTARVAAPAEPTHASCEQALFSGCAGECSNGFGACTPSTEGTIGAFDCECATNGLERVVEAPGCSEALAHACSPLGFSDAHCAGYGGYCDTLDPTSLETLRCTCADGTTHDVDRAPLDEAGGPWACRDVLEATCGLGMPPEGALCMDEGNGYVARCTRGPDPSDEHVCECYPKARTNELPRVDDLVGGVCDASGLREVCPEIAPLEEGARQAACEHFESCGSRITDFSLQACVSNAEDACIACVQGELSRATIGDDGCAEPSVWCDAPCRSIVPKEVAVQACETRAEEHAALEAGAACLCDRCYPAFGDCLADAGCVEILSCAVEQDCEGGACQLDPVCGPIIDTYLSTRSIPLVLAFAACEERDACAQ